MKEGMRMPGFTAEASLYKPRRHYGLMVSQSGDGQVIIPQKVSYPIHKDYPICGPGEPTPGECCYRERSKIVQYYQLVCHVD